MNTLLLIDGDLYAYRHASAVEVKRDWGDSVSYDSDTSAAIRNIKRQFDTFAKKYGGARILVALSGQGSFRKDINPTYKSNRAGVRRPTALQSVLQYLSDTFESKDKPRLEADDVLGIIGTNPNLYPDYDKVIVSGDKDMRTLPCRVWGGTAAPESTITEEQADTRFLIQTLMGDPTDGYKGCRSIGKAKAAKIAPKGWAAVLDTFLARGHTEDYALLMARMARILRWTDYDYVKQQPILWEPKID